MMFFLIRFSNNNFLFLNTCTNRDGRFSISEIKCKKFNCTRNFRIVQQTHHTACAKRRRSQSYFNQSNKEEEIETYRRIKNIFKNNISILVVQYKTIVIVIVKE